MSDADRERVLLERKEIEALERSEQRRQYRETVARRNAKREAVRQLPCLTCGAAIGRACLGVRGEPRVSNHRSRHVDALELGLIERGEVW